MERKDRIINILCELNEINNEDGMVNEDFKIHDLGLNSISFVRAVVAIEMEFDVEFEDEDLDFSKYETVKDIIDCVEKVI